jgi:DNA modification methylase
VALVKRVVQPRQRRALSARGGALRTDGEPGTARLLGEALRLSTGELGPDDRALPHGFHSYPARFHPALVRRLLDGISPGATVLDPFCGSGTTLVEAALAGARGFGVDINPLAVELSRLKATPLAEPLRRLLVAEAQRISSAALARVKARARTRTSGNQYDDPRHYQPHIFRELVGLREELDGADASVRPILLLVLSSIIVKVSKQPSDTAAGEVERSIGKGMPSRLFARRAEELERQLATFASRVPPGTPPPDVRSGDARRLSHLQPRSIDLVITSPPYLGTYDYAAQHARRFGWLGLDARAMETAEIGARRRATGVAKGPADAFDVWQRDVDTFIGELARVLGGSAYVVIGDSAVGSRVVEGDAAIRKASEKFNLQVVAHAAQERPNFYAPLARVSRNEHLLLLRPRFSERLP